MPTDFRVDCHRDTPSSARLPLKFLKTGLYSESVSAWAETGARPRMTTDDDIFAAVTA
ncbi:MAG: hypothetical protein H6907_06580 [Hyphomicrobiales bacterium]|nr:hypothetical protein [Hyphomicrobiales bacterium]